VRRGDLERWQELEDTKFLLELVQARIMAGLTQGDVAKAWGVPVDWIEEFERFGTYDPRLSEIRRYAAAIGAQFQHRVIVLPVAVDDDPALEMATVEEPLNP
jgi:predicted transcriptional regulator